MVNETDMSAEQKWLGENLANKAIKNFKRRGINAVYASDRNDGLSRVLEMIPEGATIGIGDSVTLYQIGIFDHLDSKKPRQVFHPTERDSEGNYLHPPRGEAFIELSRQALTSDVFLAGTNAFTLDGKLVNVDGFGNRVAAMIFGPRKVILVVGTNKMVKDVDEAMARIKNVCAPLNAKRHVLKHHRVYENLPCVITGLCADCSSPARTCRYTVIIESSAMERLNLVIIGESLGI